MASPYADRMAQELATYQEVEKVHDLPAIYQYWSKRYVAPGFQEVSGGKTLHDFYVRAIVELCAKRAPAAVSVLSLGSGNAESEIPFIKSVLEAGYDNVHLLGIEVNEPMRRRSEVTAAEAGISDFVTFQPGNLNTWTAQAQHDVFYASHCLHHVVELEHLFGQVAASMPADGVFLINDNDRAQWPHALAGSPGHPGSNLGRCARALSLQPGHGRSRAGLRQSRLLVHGL